MSIRHKYIMIICTFEQLLAQIVEDEKDIKCCGEFAFFLQKVWLIADFEVNLHLYIFILILLKTSSNYERKKSLPLRQR